jgi:hypothetical protein
VESVSSEKTYYKTSQFIPTKGESFSYYECDDNFQVSRFLTYIPETDELERVEVDWTMELRQEGAEEVEEDEFLEHWEKGEDENS